MKSVPIPSGASAPYAPGRLRPIAAAGVILVLLAWLWPLPHSADVAGDLRIYRGAIEAMLRGGGLYSYAMPLDTGPSPFLYPPFAALVMLPAQGLPLASVISGWTVTQVAMTVVLSLLLLRDARWRTGLVVPAASWAMFLLSGPVMFDINIGQISLGIMILALADIVLLGPRSRGALIGVAGAIKLTPMFFVLYFLVTRQWRAAITTTASFCGATVMGFVVFPRESFEYWTSIVFQSSRIPGLGSPRNLTILGDLRMWGVPDSVGTPTWAVLALSVAVLALYAGWRHFRAGEPVAAGIVVGLATTVIGPIAWDHHLVWLVAAAVYIVLNRSKGVAVWGWVLLALSLVASPIWPHEETPVLWRRLAGMVPLVLSIGISCVGLPRKSDVASLPAELTQRASEESPSVAGAAT